MIEKRYLLVVSEVVKFVTHTNDVPRGRVVYNVGMSVVVSMYWMEEVGMSISKAGFGS